MQVNKYSCHILVEFVLKFEVSATNSEEAKSLVISHLEKIHERQWEAPHSAPGIKLIEERKFHAEITEPSLLASENP